MTAPQNDRVGISHTDFSLALEMTGRAVLSSTTRFFTSFRMTGRTLLSLRGAAGDVGVSPTGARLSLKIEILTSRAQHAPQNDRTEEIASHRFLARARNDRANGFIVHNQILHFVQNDKVVEIVSKELCATFSSKAVSCNAQRKLGGRAVLDVLPVHPIKRAAANGRFSRKRLITKDVGGSNQLYLGNAAQEIHVDIVGITENEIGVGAAGDMGFLVSYDIVDGKIGQSLVESYVAI